MQRSLFVLLATAFVVSSAAATEPRAASAVPSLGAAPGERHRDERVEVVLRSEQASVIPGVPLTLGLEFRLTEPWHVYWTNPGDSGEAPSVRWSLPAGFTAGPLLFPVPEAIRTGPILDYGYSRHVLLATDVDTPTALRTGSQVELSADVRWLACRAEECIPGEARLVKVLKVETAQAPRLAETAELFAAARQRLPRPWPSELDASASRSSIAVTLKGLVAPDGPATVEFFPLERGTVTGEAAQATWLGGSGLRVELVMDASFTRSAQRVSGLVVVSQPDRRHGYLVDAVARAAAGGLSLGLALVLALAGGVILNLMPCVFPVLSLKVLSFVEQAGSDPHRVRRHGWAFTAGVLASFWVLAGVLLALRGAGESLGWGFQLQSPVFLAALCATLMLFALSLGGVFEIGLSLTAINSTRTESVHGYQTSFWTGALATIVATPCTAPFMGSALGFALTQPAAVGLLVFTALGFGMALPYLILSYAPRLLAALPRPGAWMETFRQLMAFPLYATVLWLLHVFSRQTGEEAVWRLMAALLLLGMAAWAWGVAQRHPRESRTLRRVAPLLAGFALVFAAMALRSPATTAGVAHEAVASAFWEPWSPERVAKLRAEGKPVFVNFTAEWCLSCQVNERVVFATDAVRELFRNYGVVALEADWTNEDARIAETLAGFGRDGVPLYVFYPPGVAEPVVLPQVPTQASLRDAFARSKPAAARVPAAKENQA
jgi:thiol:disulfide interchange protein DsbD